MSYITDILIQGADEIEIEPLNEWLLENDERKQQFRKISMENAGGGKVYTSDVWAAAFNYVPLELCEKLRDPKTWGTSVLQVCVIVDDEEGMEAYCFAYSDGEYRAATERDRLV